MVGDLLELRSQTSLAYGEKEMGDEDEGSPFAKDEDTGLTNDRLLELFNRYGTNINLAHHWSVNGGNKADTLEKPSKDRSSRQQSSLIYHAALEPLLRSFDFERNKTWLFFFVLTFAIRTAYMYIYKDIRISVSEDRVIGLNTLEDTHTLNVSEIWEKRISFESLCYCLEDLKIKWSANGLQKLFRHNDLDRQQHLTYYQFLFTLHCLSPQMKAIWQPLLGGESNEWYKHLPLNEYNVRGEYQLRECVDLLQLALKREQSKTRSYADGAVFTMDDYVFLSHQIVKHVLQMRDSFQHFPPFFQNELWSIYQKLV
ncbi:hypothetical protein RFI_28287 [Reticulomyxa filosa]|uniref:EF-hand domain-containing protein n=1 Tax=Reticulomyxa filosa TaxID=46433 RepID=X6M624_RETFI|nr:hypothetical protein RFI_28287 [Reticulomyxa filosa]|eukprot:ETO09101.1 hypothetical protein RFI_28287 [Reticulomyxa filosa]